MGGSYPLAQGSGEGDLPQDKCPMKKGKKKLRKSAPSKEDGSNGAREWASVREEKRPRRQWKPQAAGKKGGRRKESCVPR